jgi:hypothetical protein
MRKILLAAIAGFCFVAASAQQDYWSRSSKSNVASTDKAVARRSFPTQFDVYSLNIAPLRQQLFSIVGAQASRQSTIISLPNADGQLEQFEVV